MKNILLAVKIVVDRNKILITNFSYLSLMSIFSLLVPLATYPYLIRILGKDVYGVIVFSQAIIGYFVMLVSFGFNTSATRDISRNRDDKIKLSEIVSSVLIIKGFLLIISFVLLLIGLFFIPAARGYHLLFVLTMWLTIYEFIFPIWYFQGIEEMKYITYLTLISKLIFFGLVFVFIKCAEDYLWVPIINGIGSLISGFCSLYIIFKLHNIQFKFQKTETLKKYFIESLPLFVSSISVSIFVQANKIIIGAYVGMSEVAYYDLAEKIVQLLKLPQILITQAIFPKTSKGGDVSFIKKMMLFSISLALLLFVGIQLFANEIVVIMGGVHMGFAAKLLRVLSVAVIIIYISQYTSVHTLLANGYNRVWMRMLLISGFIYLIMIFILASFSNVSAMNLVYISLLSEFYLLGSSYYYSKKFKLL